MTVDAAPVVRRVPARAGLVGNPSDGFGGAVLALPVPSLAGEVVVAPAPDEQLRIGDEVWSSVAVWRDHVRRHGHVGDAALIGAALQVVDDHLRNLAGGGIGAIAVTWSTTIPRSVGLAGSSALAVGVVDAVAAVHRVVLPRLVVAALALAAEVDVLGVAAGWQDRVVQAVRVPVLVDAGSLSTLGGVTVPGARELDLRATGAAELVIGWQADRAEGSAGYHGRLRRNPGAVAAVRDAMDELAALARHAAGAAVAGDLDELGRCVDAGWLVRDGAAPLRDDHRRLVAHVRAEGLHATTPGSGGSVVVLACDAAEADRADEVLAGLGCGVARSPVATI